MTYTEIEFFEMNAIIAALETINLWVDTEPQRFIRKHRLYELKHEKNKCFLYLHRFLERPPLWSRFIELINVPSLLPAKVLDAIIETGMANLGNEPTLIDCDIYHDEIQEILTILNKGER